MDPSKSLANGVEAPNNTAEANASGVTVMFGPGITMSCATSCAVDPLAALCWGRKLAEIASAMSEARRLSVMGLPEGRTRRARPRSERGGLRRLVRNC